MNFSFMLSLEHVALVKIVTTLWNQEDIRSLWVKSDLQFYKVEQWQKIEDKVAAKVHFLHQPRHLKEKILGAIKPIGKQICDWLDYHRIVLRFAINFQNEIHWTSLGTLDRKKTVEALVRDETVDIAKRFKLACIYCLEDDIEALREYMPENRIRLSCKEEFILEYWNQQIVWGENVVHRTLRYGNPVAAEYFWNKLTPTEREESINIAGSWCCRDVEFFHLIISHLNEEQLLKLYKMNDFWIIALFLDWPMQNFCMDFANLVWDYLHVHDYCSLLKLIVYKIVDGYKDYCYRELFKQFWMQSPSTHKDYVIKHCETKPLLSMLFEIKDEKNISLILKEATAEEKENILFHSKSIRICISLAGRDEWNLLKFFVCACISSRDKMEKFKHKCEEDDAWSDFTSETCVRRKFSEFLNDLMQNFDKKRGTEEEDSALRLRKSSND